MVCRCCSRRNRHRPGTCARMIVEEEARQLDSHAALSDRVQPLAAGDAKFKGNASRFSISEPCNPNGILKLRRKRQCSIHSSRKDVGRQGAGAIHGLDLVSKMANRIRRWMCWKRERHQHQRCPLERSRAVALPPKFSSGETPVRSLAGVAHVTLKPDKFTVGRRLVPSRSCAWSSVAVRKGHF
jgi:hypothetical protein